MDNDRLYKIVYAETMTDLFDTVKRNELFGYKPQGPISFKHEGIVSQFLVKAKAESIENIVRKSKG